MAGVTPSLLLLLLGVGLLEHVVLMKHVVLFEEIRYAYLWVVFHIARVLHRSVAENDSPKLFSNGFFAL